MGTRESGPDEGRQHSFQSLGPDGLWELYNLKSDRTEQQDLAAQHPDKVRQLLDQWEAWARRAHAIPWIWKPAYGESAQPGQAPEKPKKKAKRYA